MSSRVDLPDPDVTFSEAEVNAFMNQPVWKGIETLIKSQRAAVIASLCSSFNTREDDLVLKGNLEVINYFLNLKTILTEGSDEESNAKKTV